MDIISGKLKPRPADSSYGFVVPNDGSPDVYIKFSDLTDKTLLDLYGCELTLRTAPSDRGPMAIEIIDVKGEPVPLPVNTKSEASSSSARRGSRSDMAPGQYLSRWANIDLVDHDHVVEHDDGSRTEKHYASVLPELHSILLAGEEWDFESEKKKGRLRILGNYIRFMFYRLYRENKIAFSKDNGIAIFDTGLVDNLFEPIYGVFYANRAESKRPYRFEGWCRPGRGQLGKRILEPFSRLPDRAEFFSNINDVILPKDIEVVEQWEHIIDDGIRRGRYPAKFLRRYVPDSFEFNENLADGIGATMAERMEYLGDLVEVITEGRDYLEFKHKIESCIKTALKRVEWNYKTAIPIYHPRRDRMSIALPLALFDSETADLALILEKKNVRTYYASTVLTLDQAYLSARLVCRPLSDWLTTNIGVAGLDIDS